MCSVAMLEFYNVLGLFLKTLMTLASKDGLEQYWVPRWLNRAPKTKDCCLTCWVLWRSDPNPHRKYSIFVYLETSDICNIWSL